MKRAVYVVPKLSERGGVQEFATRSAASLEQDFQVDFYDTGTDLQTKLRRLARLTRDSGVRQADLVHHWHFMSALSRPSAHDFVTCHGNELLDSRYRFLAGPLLRSARGLICNSNYTKQLAIERWSVPESKVHVVHPAIAGSKLLPRLESTNDEFQVGTLSRLVPRKNVSAVVDALIHIKSLGFEFTYHLAGDGPQREMLVDKLRQSKVPYRYWGVISDNKRDQDFFPNLDAFVLPALNLPGDVEGFGIVYLEANRAGSPVVAANTGGVADSVREGVSGTFVEPDDAGSIAEGILRVWNSPSLRESSRDWALQFNMEKLRSDLLSAYTSPQ